MDDQKPHIDRLNKTGSALVKVVGQGDAVKLQAIIDDDTARYDAVRTAMRERSNSLDEALQQSAEFMDQLEAMIETLAGTADQVEKADSISAHPDKLREQIADNRALMEDLDKKMAAIDNIRSSAEDLLGQKGMDDEAARG